MRPVMRPASPEKTYLQLPLVGGLLGLGVTVYLLVTRVLLIASAVLAGLLVSRGVL